MAGPRANLAVTKDGETYNKLQRPHDFLNDVAACDQTNERKRERAAVGSSVAEPGIGNKRAKIQHATLTAAISRPNDDERQYRGAGPVSECGMRMTLPIDEEDLHSDDSLGEALAYLRSVRSEASSIPHLLVASKTNTNDVDNTSQQRAAPTTPHAVYQDGAWISVDESYDATYNDNHAQDNLDPQDIYHKRLMKRFEALRSTLSAYGLHRSTPARRSIDGANRSTSGPPPSNRHEWLYTIDREFPTEAQISQLDQKSVRRGLEYCVHAMDRFDTISSQKSCWIWTLLAMSGDIGTLDSQKMSHIRDLGNKAGQLSSRLHRGPELQSRVIEKDQLHASPATNGAEDVHEASESAVRKDSSDEHDPAQGFVRSDGNERPISTTAITLGTTPLKTPHDLQSPDATSGISDVSTDLGRDTDTDMNNDTLERARARLLAQLGDNLVQAGIPASSQSPVGADQPDENQDDSQSKVKVRTIPSRAEAERQRQLMRTQYSAAQGSRGVRVLEPNTTATGSSCEDHSSSLVDLNTRVTIDMILTVVGECYGQRDLLKFRKAW